MFILSYILHSCTSIHSYYYTCLVITLSMYTSLIYYSFLQINFSLISHNFGFRDSDLVDIRLFYFIFLILFFMKSIISAVSLLTINHYHRFSAMDGEYSWYRLYSLMLSFIIVSASLVILFNDLA